MAITTTESFLELLRKSKLLSADQLGRSEEAAQGAADAVELAKTLVREKLLTRWQAGQLLAGRASFFLGRYKLIDLLGQGGMGKVFRAEDTMMTRPVALKIISKQLGRDPAALERFLGEVRAVAALNHPNIVHAYNVDQEGDRYFLVMEFVEGHDLERAVGAKGPLDFARSADYVRQAAEGLAHAHGREMIHCDVKPANLLVSKQGVVKILDLGMARLLARDEDRENGEDEHILGTVDYLAPEQAVGSPDLDHRVDIYSLGCTFYFLLTGHPPFPEGTLPERIVKHQTQDPPPLAGERPGVPEQLAAICEKMMAKDPAARFQSVAEVARLLTDWKPTQRELKKAVRMADADSTKASPSEVSAESTPEEEDLGPLGIKIDTRDRGIATRAEAKPREAKSGESGEPGEPRAGWLGTLLADRRKLIVAATVGAVAVVGLAAAFFLFRGGAESQSTEMADATSAGSADQAGPLSSKSDDDGFPEPQMVEGGLTTSEGGQAGGPKPVAAADPAKPDAAATGAPATGAPAAANKPEPAAGEPSRPNQASPSDKPADEPLKTPPETPKTPEKPPETPKKPPETPEKPPETPKKPEKPKEPSPQTPAAGDDPLKDLADLTVLAELRESDPPGEKSKAPVSFGQIHSGADVAWQLFLLGGEHALKGARQFVFSPEKTGVSEATWLVELDAAAGKERVRSPVGRFSRRDGGLEFQWAEEAEASSANYLRNCVLQVRVEGKTKYVSLREPVAVEPIAVDLARGQANQTADVKWAPEDDRLQIQITRMEDRKDLSLKPAEPVAPKTPVLLSFPRTDRHGNTRDGVELRFFPTVRRSSLAMDVRLQSPPAAVFRPFAAGGLSDQQLGVQMDMATSKRGELQKRSADAKGEDRTKLSNQIDLLEQQIWYLEFYLAVQKKPKLHYRIFIDADGQQVVLARSEPDPPAAD